MRLLVCGGRDYLDWVFLCETLNRYKDQVEVVIHGGARGADSMAGAWAENNKIPQLCYLADWKTHGLKAGPIRNKQMLDEGKPDLVLAFPGGSGTNNMVAQARKAGVRVVNVGGILASLKAAQQK